MKVDTLRGLFRENDCDQIIWEGECHDGCGKKIEVSAKLYPDERIQIEGGAVYSVSANGKPVSLLKCDDCFSKDPEIKNWNPMEVYSRVCGYLRPVKAYNPGKKAEFNFRKDFKGVG